MADAPRLSVGDTWAFVERNAYNGEQVGTLRQRIIEASAGAIRVEADRGSATGSRIDAYTREWNALAASGPEQQRLEFSPAFPAYAFPLGNRASWMTDVVAIDQRNQRRVRVKVRGKVLGWERVRVPAGEFDALRVRREVWIEDGDLFRTGTTVFETDWYAPAVNHVVRREDKSHYINKMTTHGRSPAVVRGDWHLYELSSYQAA